VFSSDVQDKIIVFVSCLVMLNKKE
jgi:hypothetical protein